MLLFASLIKAQHAVQIILFITDISVPVPAVTTSSTSTTPTSTSTDSESTTTSLDTTTNSMSTSKCPKCAIRQSTGKLSCCAEGGAWFKKCGGFGSNSEHTWYQGREACKGGTSLA